MIELKVWLVLMRRDLIRILDNFLHSLHNLLIVSGLGLVDLTNLRFFLICANRGHLGGLGGGGGRVIALLVAEAYLIRVSLTEEKNVSKRALEDEIVKAATRSSRIGVILETYSAIPLGVYLIHKGEGAFDSLGRGLGGISIQNFTIKTSCVLSKSGLFRGHKCWYRDMVACVGGLIRITLSI